MCPDEHHLAATDGATVSIRLLNDGALDGPINMARDEALLECVRRDQSPPTLRLYEWRHPTISLGYFQPFAEYEALASPAGELDVVRRLTGGGAILHDRELTYSLVLPMSYPLAKAGPNRLYELVHSALISCLAEQGVQAATCGVDDASRPARGPFFCFARRHRCDLIVQDKKVAGSAQRRTREAVLQHGSIVLERRFDQHPTADIARPAIADALRGRFSVRLAARLGAALADGAWRAGELASADRLAKKYAGDDWTRRK